MKSEFTQFMPLPEVGERAQRRARRPSQAAREEIADHVLDWLAALAIQ